MASARPLQKIRLFVVKNLIWAIVVFVFLVFSVTLPNFFTLQNVHLILYVASAIGMLVFAESLVLISGSMDLSVAHIAGLSSMLVGSLTIQWLPFLPGWTGIILIVIVGALLGSVNGFFVGWVGINPFLVTLSTFLMYNWLTFLLNRGAITNVSPALVFLGGAQVLGIYVAIILLLVLCVFLGFILTRTRFGGYVHAMGGNPEATRMLGISLPWMSFGVFTIAGALAGLAGLLYVGYLDSIPSTIAGGDDIFLAFAGAIIGGVSLKGGEGTMTGALGGVLLLGIIDTGTAMTLINPALRGFLDGLILLLAILINKYRVELRDRILMPKPTAVGAAA
ncbi:MAG TPA: ABC transporter permease [Spirochaetia bacterium]|nr:ABC transporter permease [Spirochaetia bacterium]